MTTTVESTILKGIKIERALVAAGGTISGDGGAAQLLNLAPSTLTSRMKALRSTKPGK
jgi:hypothetical protein